jgi:hypothetical protein
MNKKINSICAEQNKNVQTCGADVKGSIYIAPWSQYLIFEMENGEKISSLNNSSRDFPRIKLAEVKKIYTTAYIHRRATNLSGFIRFHKLGLLGFQKESGASL